MKIFETRGKIKDIKDARDTAEKIGAIYKGFYSCTDFVFKTKNIGDIIRLRVFKINNRQSKQSKDYIFIHKIAEWHDKIKTDKIIIKRELDTMEETLDFMINHYGYVLVNDYEYSRIGWEYSHNENSIFIENIDMLGPTLEIESDNKNDIENLFKFFDVSELFTESVAEIMRKLLGK